MVPAGKDGRRTSSADHLTSSRDHDIISSHVRIDMEGLREESAKMIYRNGEIVGMMKQNGALKIYQVKEVNYSEVDELFNTPSAQ